MGEENKQIVNINWYPGHMAKTLREIKDSIKLVDIVVIVLDARVPFASLNMDVYEIIRICNMHPRVNILQPGPGVGGHCISVDPWFLVGDYPSLAKVIDESMKTNDGMPDFVLNRIHEIMKENGITDFSRVGLYGLSYKENVDDPRESPTIQLLENQEHLHMLQVHLSIVILQHI